MASFRTSRHLALALAYLLGVATASFPVLHPRQNSTIITCPKLHVFGARETTAPPGFGTAGFVVNDILDAFPGATSEAIDYPAAPDDQYAASVAAGIDAVVTQMTAFVQKCPETQIVLVGYSQGGQVLDTTFCGGPDGQSLTEEVVPMPPEIGAHAVAMIWMGNPRFVEGLPYNIGNATIGGFAARPSGFVCDIYSDLIQSYCDDPDPFCSGGDDAVFHQLYAENNGEEALAFVSAKVAVENASTLLPTATSTRLPFVPTTAPTGMPTTTDFPDGAEKVDAYGGGSVLGMAAVVLMQWIL